MVRYKILRFFKNKSQYNFGHYVVYDGFDIKIHYGYIQTIEKSISIEEYQRNVDYRVSRGITDSYIENNKEIIEFVSIYQRELKFIKLNSY